MHSGEPAADPDQSAADTDDSGGLVPSQLPEPAHELGRTGTVSSVNIAQPTQFELRGKLHETGICKTPAPASVPVTSSGLAGDVQADLRVHGGEFKAVYAYPGDDYRWWAGQLGEQLEPGRFGENLTIEGLSATGARIGERWRVGTAVLQVTQPREPCWKLGVRMDDPDFPRRFRRAGRPGAYFSVHTAGAVGPGDTIEVVHIPPHPITIALINRLNASDRQLSNLLLRLCRQGLSAAEWQQVLSSPRP